MWKNRFALSNVGNVLAKFTLHVWRIFQVIRCVENVHGENLRTNIPVTGPSSDVFSLIISQAHTRANCVISCFLFFFGCTFSLSHKFLHRQWIHMCQCMGPSGVWRHMSPSDEANKVGELTVDVRIMKHVVTRKLCSALLCKVSVRMTGSFEGTFTTPWDAHLDGRSFISPYHGLVWLEEAGEFMSLAS